MCEGQTLTHDSTQKEELWEEKQELLQKETFTTLHQKVLKKMRFSEMQKIL